MPFEQKPSSPPVEAVPVYLVTRRGGKRACGFGSEAEAKGEADALRMGGLVPHIAKRWVSKTTWENAPDFEGYA